MTIPSTYNNIITAVQEELEDFGNEFILNVPTAISMAELRINKELDGLFQNAQTNINVVANTAIVNKPSDYKWGYNLFYRTNSVNAPRTLLRKMTDDWLKDYTPSASTSGSPKYYSDINSSTWRLAPVPNSNITIEVDYGAYPAALSSSNQTNITLTKFPDLVWYATLVEQSNFARMPEASNMYEQKYQNALNKANEELRRERADNTYQVNTPIVSQNRKDREG